MASASEDPLYASRNAGIVRLVTALSLAAAVLGTAAALHLFTTLESDPVHGVLAPLGLRLVYAAATLLPGVGFAAFMWQYGRRYVVALTLDADAGSVRVTTLSGLTVRTRAVPLEWFEGWAPEGGLAAEGLEPAGPMLRVQLRDDRTLLLDLRAEIPSWARLDAVLRGRTGGGPARRRP